MENKAQTAKIKILRYTPEKDQKPYYQDYSLSFADEKINMLQALNMIYETQDSTLAFRQYCCGHQLCNSCLMVINGKPAYACKTLVTNGTEFEVAPLWNKPVIRDLVVEM
jgi:succinate dehydrogenase/fumarate reductase iron-sulfur protein